MTIHAFKKLLLTQVKEPFFFVNETFKNDEILKDSLFAETDSVRITYKINEWTASIKNFFNPEDCVTLKVKKGDDGETVIENMREIKEDIGNCI